MTQALQQNDLMEMWKRLVRTPDSWAIFANNGVGAIQSPQNKPAGLPLFYWRLVCKYLHISWLRLRLRAAAAHTGAAGRLRRPAYCLGRSTDERTACTVWSSVCLAGRQRRVTTESKQSLQILLRKSISQNRINFVMETVSQMCSEAQMTEVYSCHTFCACLER